MVRLVEAWKILSDPEKRSRYDQLVKFQHDGWRSRKFNVDVQNARKGAEEHATRSWSEFEEIYQKAFFTFNKDFYGEDIDERAAGPYSPLMEANGKAESGASASRSAQAARAQKSSERVWTVTVMKTLILFAAIVAALFMYRYYSDIGRYIPLEHKNISSILMWDTTTDAVYSAGKKALFTFPPQRRSLDRPFPNRISNS
jgi:curved DNA-binding protein CbpA